MCFSVTFTTTQGVVTLAEEATISPIKVVYLKQFEDTPFATRVEKYIRLKVDGTTLNPSDVASKVGNNALGCLASRVTSYKYISSLDCYLAVYAETVYLNAKSEDGNQESYFLDLNNSYYSFYSKFLTSSGLKEINNQYFGIDTSEDLCLNNLKYGGDYSRMNGNDETSGLAIVNDEFFNYCLNRLFYKYPDTANLQPNEIFGYWGFVVVPKANSITSLIASNLLSIETSYSGVVDDFKYGDFKLSNKQYTALLKDYNYNFLEILWARFINLLKSSDQEADAYFCYASGEYNEAFIAENGAESIDDNRGAVIVAADKALDSVGDSLKDLLDVSDDLKKILAVIFGLCGAFIILILFFKILGVFNKARRQIKKANKKNEKKRRKQQTDSKLTPITVNQKASTKKLESLNNSISAKIHKDK